MPGQHGLAANGLSLNEEKALQRFNEIAQAMRSKYEQADHVYHAVSDTLTAARLLVDPKDAFLWHSVHASAVETSNIIKLSVNNPLSPSDATYFVDIQDEGQIRITQELENPNEPPIVVIPFAQTPEQTTAHLIFALRRIHPKINQYFKSAQASALSAK